MELYIYTLSKINSFGPNHGLITLESPLIFLGPSYGSNGISEVYLLPTPSSGLTSATCTIPTYPMTDIWGSVGFVYDGYLQICGKVTLSLPLPH